VGVVALFLAILVVSCIARPRMCWPAGALTDVFRVMPAECSAKHPCRLGVWFAIGFYLALNLASQVVRRLSSVLCAPGSSTSPGTAIIAFAGAMALHQIGRGAE